MYTFAYDEALKKKELHKYTFCMSYDEGVEVETEVMINDDDELFFFMPLGDYSKNCTKKKKGNSVTRTTSSTLY